MPGRLHTKKAVEEPQSKVEAAIEFAHQSERLAQYTPGQENDTTGSTQAVEARFITGQDAVVETANGGRLPAVPFDEAMKLNRLKDILEDRDPDQSSPVRTNVREAKDGTIHGGILQSEASKQQEEPGAPLREAVPSYRTNPLFPPLPMYGPPTLMRDIQVLVFRASSAILSLCFLIVIILGAIFTSIPTLCRRLYYRFTFRNPDKRRPFFEEEQKRMQKRRQEEKEWARQHLHENSTPKPSQDNEYVPMEGGPDPLVCDIQYYARRVGLDSETFEVQTEDGFIIDLWHIFDPREQSPAPADKLKPNSPDIFPQDQASSTKASKNEHASAYTNKRYPILMIHGLLQSAGAYCCNNDDSLAFYLHKSGYDVWLGNNRCGFKPRHSLLRSQDPRMWAWNIRQMGVMDLPALISRVLTETGFPKLGLVAHSQGTTQTFVALAKEQRPEIGEKISVFCALAPAVYAGPLIGKMYFKFMRVISPSMFRAIFGIHAFIPFMMTMHSLLPGKFYGAMGYLVFSFLFNWTDERWERDLRNRFFQFAPVYVSAEAMRWWLGRECFARQKCILATRKEIRIEDEEDKEEDHRIKSYYDRDSGHGHLHPSEDIQQDNNSDVDHSDDEHEGQGHGSSASPPARKSSHHRASSLPDQSHSDRSKYAWYSPSVPPMAFWICGNDDLVNGRRLLRRFERGREPHVDLVHSKIIEGYEHLDVIWAMDAIEKVGVEVREVIWKTAPEGDWGRDGCRVPLGCENIEKWGRNGEEDTIDKAKPKSGTKAHIDGTIGERLAKELEA
jgi:pimeloyl-ACP methyl ester carboxylesterase